MIEDWEEKYAHVKEKVTSLQKEAEGDYEKVEGKLMELRSMAQQEGSASEDNYA